MTKKAGKPPRTALGLIDRVLGDNARTLRSVLLMFAATGCLAVVAFALGPGAGELCWTGLGGVLAVIGGRLARKRAGDRDRK